MKKNTKEHQQGNNRSHDLILGQALRGLGALHHLRAGTRMHILDKRNSQRTASILVASELGWRGETVSNETRKKKGRHYRTKGTTNSPIAVSASSALSNSTTPVPRERPLGSYWISARSTLPIVENRSIRSSLQVDQGSYCPSQQLIRILTPLAQTLVPGNTHIANINNRASLAARGCKISEWVRGIRGNGSFKATAAKTTTTTTRSTTSETTTATESTGKAAATSKATTTTAGEATATSKAATEAATTTETGATASEAVLPNLKRTSLPLIAIELRNCVARIVGRLKCDNARTLGATGRVGVHICTNNGTLLGCRGGSSQLAKHHKR